MKKLTLLTVLLLIAGACATTQGPRAVATLAPTTANSTANGTVTLSANHDGTVMIEVALKNVPPGVHGFHIHEKGDCGDSGNAAGGHFNPAASQHGDPASPPHHAGDFGNVTADANGNVNATFTSHSITLDNTMATSAVGKAFILHANPDDLKTQPTGNAGGRIACGVVELR
jgi:Cu-Zn family superoxide dismutase